MIPFSHVSSGDEANLTAFLPGQATPSVAHSSHANFKAILAALMAQADGQEIDPATLGDLFDASVAVAKRFKRLSERVTVAGGMIYFDGDPIDNSLTNQVVRFLDEGVANWKPLINFFEKVQSNPDEHSREQLFAWLDRHDFTIMENGDLLAYKGVRSDGDGGYTSLHSGPAVVDGVSMNGYVPNAVGSVIEIPRSYVANDPSSGCAQGLHVGTYAYARGYSSSGCLLRVSVNPRDVVSVPTDCDAQKVRVCRYMVDEIITDKVASPVFDAGFKVGGLVEDEDGDRGIIVVIEPDGLILVDMGDYWGVCDYTPEELTRVG